MNRPISQILDQRTSYLPQRKTYLASVHSVLFPSHQVVVSFPGHSRVVADVDISIDFGSQSYPKISRGYNCTVTIDEQTGHWVATKPTPSNSCIPTSPSNVPQIALPTYRVPIIVTPPPVITFPTIPGFPPMPAITPLPVFVPSTSIPPIVFPAGSVRLSWGDGFYGAIGTSTVQQFAPAVTVEAMHVDKISAYSDVTDIIIELFLTNGAYADYMMAYRTFDGKWEVGHYNPSTGALIGTAWLSGVTNTVNAHPLTGADIITIPSGTLIHADVQVGTNAVTVGVAYGCGGY